MENEPLPWVLRHVLKPTQETHPLRTPPFGACGLGSVPLLGRSVPGGLDPRGAKLEPAPQNSALEAPEKAAAHLEKAPGQYLLGVFGCFRVSEPSFGLGPFGFVLASLGSFRWLGLANRQTTNPSHQEGR